MRYRIYPPEGIPEASVSLPPSKSVKARRLVISAIAGEKIASCEGMCEDLSALSEALTSEKREKNLAESGTALRFLTAYYATEEGADVTLDGAEGLRHRPIGTLVDALRSLGGEVEYLGEEGFAPIRIKGHKLSGGILKTDPRISSQWISALMMAGTRMRGGLRMEFPSTPPSFPYIELTAGEMEKAAAEVDYSRYHVEVKEQEYELPRDWGEDGECDWSAAAFMYETVALTAGWMTLKGLKENSAQGDKVSMELFHRLGVETEFTEEGAELSASPEMYSRMDFDAGDCPDMVPSVVVACCTLGVPFRITGTGALRHKECDRGAALAEELQKLGCEIEILRGGIIEWDGRRKPLLKLPEINPHGDHRIAMAFAPVSIFLPGLIIDDVECVKKSWPGYWESLREAGFETVDADMQENESDTEEEKEAES